MILIICLILPESLIYAMLVRILVSLVIMVLTTTWLNRILVLIVSGNIAVRACLGALRDSCPCTKSMLILILIYRIRLIMLLVHLLRLGGII